MLLQGIFERQLSIRVLESFWTLEGLSKNNGVRLKLLRIFKKEVTFLQVFLNRSKLKSPAIKKHDNLSVSVDSRYSKLCRNNGKSPKGTRLEVPGACCTYEQDGNRYETERLLFLAAYLPCVHHRFWVSREFDNSIEHVNN